MQSLMPLGYDPPMTPAADLVRLYRGHVQYVQSEALVDRNHLKLISVGLHVLLEGRVKWGACFHAATMKINEHSQFLGILALWHRAVDVDLGVVVVNLHFEGAVLDVGLSFGQPLFEGFNEIGSCLFHLGLFGNQKDDPVESGTNEVIHELNLTIVTTGHEEEEEEHSQNPNRQNQREKQNPSDHHENR